MQLYTADWIHHAGTFRAGHALLVGDDGRIVAAGPAAEVRARPEAAGAEAVSLTGHALAPGAVSAHSHAFQVFLRGSGDHPLSFQDWVKRYLYPLVERLDDASLEAAASLCFAQMARAGITSVGEFHYVHNNVDDYQPRDEALARIVLRAARRVGLRIALLRAIYDVQERIGQGRMAQEIGVAIDGIRALHEEHRGDPCVAVLPAPHSLHGTTREGVEAGAALAKELGTRWHIHLAEQQGDVGYCRRTYQDTPLRVLDAWGLLDARAVVVHGIWLDEGERALLAERGGALVSNPTTNMTLGDGICAIPELLDKGVPVALGTDMNSAPNVFHEMRAAEQLQRVKSLHMGRIPRREGSETVDPARLFELGTRNGGIALGLDTGALEAGLWADMVAIDLDDPSLLPASVVGGDALMNAMSGAMVAETAVRRSWVGGRPVVVDGEVVGLPRAELVRMVRGAKAVEGLGA